MSENKKGLYESIDKSATLTVIGILLLFSGAVSVTLIAPMLLEEAWTTPASSYQVQMYEEADPNVYLSALSRDGKGLQAVHHLKDGETLLAFSETSAVRIVAPQELRQFVTPAGDETLRLTNRLLMLRKPLDQTAPDGWNGAQAAEAAQQQFQGEWLRDHPQWEAEGLQKPRFTMMELYAPAEREAFSVTDTDAITENWVDKNFQIVDGQGKPLTPKHKHGVLYVSNPEEYRIVKFASGPRQGFEYSPAGQPIKSLADLTSQEMGFTSRKDLIAMGELIYANEGCHYCHTDQTRTLIQDSVLNGSDSYPAPPSSPNEYVYQKKTFPGTRRIGPDLSRVGIKRPHRDWHKSHFWSPKTESVGSIMPAFRHFFDDDPRGTSKNPYGVPNYQFEAMFQYLMTKGTRITAPTQAWWTGDDPIRTLDIIEGRKVLR